MKRLLLIIGLLWAYVIYAGDFGGETEAEIETRVGHALAGGYDSALAFSADVEQRLWRDTATRNDELYARYLECMLRAGYPDSLRSRYMLEVVRKNMPGTMAADFEFVDRDGRRGSLYSYADRRTVLYFYDPDCDKCHDVAAALAIDSVIARGINEGRLRVLAVGATDYAEWLAHGAWLPATWADASDEGSIDENELYIIDDYPSIYLIGADHRVILRNPAISELRASIAGPE